MKTTNTIKAESGIFTHSVTVITRCLYVVTLLAISLSMNAQTPLLSEPNNFSASAAPVVGNDGTLYVYTVVPQYAEGANKVYNVMSTSDLDKWEMHDSVFTISDVKWASKDIYGGDVLYHNGKYNLFYQARLSEKPGRYVGVAQSDSPLGPFKNISEQPIAKMIDPCVYKDDDGEIYLYAERKVLALNSDLSPKGEEHNMKFVGKEFNPEGWGSVHVFKHAGTYYWVGTEKGGHVMYWVGQKPQGPFMYKGMLMPGVASTASDNHTSLVLYHGKYVFFYESKFRNVYGTPVQSKRVCAEFLQFNNDGTIKMIIPSNAGLAQN